MSHVDDGLLHALLDGELDAVGGRDAVARHVERCAPCAERLEAARLHRDEARALLRAAEPASEHAPAWADVLDRAGLREPRRGRAGAGWRLPLAWVAGVVLAAGLGWYAHALTQAPAPEARTASAAAPATSDPGRDAAPADVLATPEPPVPGSGPSAARPGSPTGARATGTAAAGAAPGGPAVEVPMPQARLQAASPRLTPLRLAPIGPVAQARTDLLPGFGIRVVVRHEPATVEAAAGDGALTSMLHPDAPGIQADSAAEPPLVVRILGAVVRSVRPRGNAGGSVAGSTPQPVLPPEPGRPEPGVIAVASSLLGRVVAEDGGPVAGARLVLRPRDGYFAQTARSDSSGSFFITPLQPGIYTLTVERYGYRTVDTGPIRIQGNTVVELHLEPQAR